MSTQTVPKVQRTILDVEAIEEYRKAGPLDLVAMLAVKGQHPLFLPKNLVELVVWGIVSHESMHISGPTGTAKSSLIEALYLEPRNFAAVCSALGFEHKPLSLYTIEMATFESPGELYQRRALTNGCTIDEPSTLVEAIQDAASNRDAYYPLIWLREMGRVHSPSVQGGLLNILEKNDIVLPGNERIAGKGIAWVADSNYQAEEDSTHTLVTFDDALKRRFSLNIKMGYLQPEQEAHILHSILRNGSADLAGENATASVAQAIQQVVRLGHAIRQRKAKGELISASPPTIYGYLTFLRMAAGLPHFSLPDITRNTLLGNVSDDEEEQVAGILNEVFGLRIEFENEPTMGGNII